VIEPTLHRDYYFSPAIFQQEKERIFFREWFCAGREEELPEPGDYLVLEVAGESLIVVRTRQGDLAAHYNVCCHRGSRLVPEGGKGSFAGAIRCPYHSWTYTLDGQLRTAPFLDEEVGVTKADLAL
jgi:glycine betaine catabolism A